MDYIIIALTALVASGLTLFSGFGLGTILLPAFALFFPVDTAVVLTAIVHLLNNLFKLYLVGGHASKDVVLKFGSGAFLAALLGAWLLLRFSEMEPVFSYTFNESVYAVTPLKLVIAVLMVVFALMEIVPALSKISLAKKWLPIGGVLSGFFGGLSGHQGALRSAFLIKYGLSKEAFIGTGVVIATIIDVSRLFIYSSRFDLTIAQANAGILITAIVAAFAGAFIGARLMKKITMKGVQYTVGIMLILIAAGLGAGII